MPGTIVIDSAAIGQLDADAGKEIQRLILQGASEPVAYELLREARDVRATGRAQLTIGLAALEVGVKRFLAERVPEEEWLLEHLPSPDVVAILRDYLPRLVNKRLCRPIASSRS